MKEVSRQSSHVGLSPDLLAELRSYTRQTVKTAKSIRWWMILGLCAAAPALVLLTVLLFKLLFCGPRMPGF